MRRCDRAHKEISWDGPQSCPMCGLYDLFYKSQTDHKEEILKWKRYTKRMASAMPDETWWARERKVQVEIEKTLRRALMAMPAEVREIFVSAEQIRADASSRIGRTILDNINRPDYFNEPDYRDEIV